MSTKKMASEKKTENGESNEWELKLFLYCRLLIQYTTSVHCTVDAQCTLAEENEK